GRVRLHQDRVREVGLLPAGGRLPGEGDRRQEGAGGGPQVADVRAGVPRPLVEPQTGDVTGRVRRELHPQLLGRRVVGRRDGRGGGARPDRRVADLGRGGEGPADGGHRVAGQVLRPADHRRVGRGVRERGRRRQRGGVGGRVIGQDAGDWVVGAVLEG